jgi:3'-phosphoadenosine 5'-phosphosulfate sulfotransferase (PAPS reductase)/FAD synthetase
MMQILAFSGGKDSTALALVMADDGEDFDLFFTPTGRELPECLAHIALVARMTGLCGLLVSD